MGITPAAQAAAMAEGAGLADLPGWPVLGVVGPDAVDLLGRLSTQDLGPVASGRAVTTVFLSPTGRVLHRVLVMPHEGSLRLLAEPGAGDALPAWIDRYTFAEDCTVSARSEWAAALLVGPEAATVAGGDLATDGAQAELDGALLARRPFGPLPSVVATGTTAALTAFRERVLAAGAVPLDAPGLEQVRVEAGVGLAGHELVEDHHALEAGLRDDVSFTKGCYTGQEVVARQDTYDKVVRRLVGLVFTGRPDVGAELSSENKTGCVVTSVATDAPAGLDAAGGPACLGYVRQAHGAEGTPVQTATGLAGRVVELPFPRFR